MKKEEKRAFLDDFLKKIDENGYHFYYDEPENLVEKALRMEQKMRLNCSERENFEEKMSSESINRRFEWCLRKIRERGW